MTISTKWPALIAYGKPVSKEQAKEIIFKTQEYLYFTLHFEDDEKEIFIKKLNIPLENKLYISNDWKKEKGILDLQYLKNERIYSCWYNGTHGWMNWDGQIFSNNYNVGKWPCDEELVAEAQKLAEAFPFLDMEFWFMHGEVCTKESKKPALHIKIKEGQVEYDSNPKTQPKYETLEVPPPNIQNPKYDRNWAYEPKEVVKILSKYAKK